MQKKTSKLAKISSANKSSLLTLYPDKLKTQKGKYDPDIQTKTCTDTQV